jgi:hypothetical protein
MTDKEEDKDFADATSQDKYAEFTDNRERTGTDPDQEGVSQDPDVEFEDDDDLVDGINN